MAACGRAGRHLGILAAACLVVTAAAAAEPVAVAVLNFANQVRGPAGQEWNWLQKGLADLVINDLSTQDGLLLVDRERMQETLTAEGIPIRPGMDLSRVTQVFVKRFKIARLVFGSFRAGADRITLNAFIVDAYSGKLLRRVRLAGEAKDVLKLQKQLSSRIIATLLGRADLKDITASLPIWTESLPASKLLYTAVDRFDRGEFPEAWLYARRAWRADWGYADALYWVGRMHYYMLQHAHARRYFEQFVYEHTTHARIGDAIVEYLHTYERAAPDMRARISEILNVLQRAPAGATIQRIGATGMRTWSLVRFLKGRLASYYQTTTEYPRATRTLEELLTPRPGRIGSGLPELLGNLYDEVRMQTGVILGQPTDVGQIPPRANTGSSCIRMANPRLLRPGCANRYSLDVEKQTGNAFHGNELLVIPPNHRISRLTFPVEASVRKQTEGFKSQLLLCLTTSRFWAAFGQQASKPVELTTDRRRYVLEMAPLTRGRLFQAALREWRSPKKGRINDLVSSDSPYRIAKMAMSAEVVPAGSAGHYYLDPGFLQAFQYGSVRLNGQKVSKGREHGWLTYLSGDDLAGHFYDEDHFPVPVRRPLASFTLRPQSGLLKALQLAPASGSIPGCPRDARVHRIAAGYSPSHQQAWRAPGIAVDKDGRWVAAWEVDGDIWVAESGDGGKSWSAPEALAVPINSAHREWQVRLVALANRTYVLSFKSDRGVPRRVRSYLAKSHDLRRWTVPRLAPIMDVQYAARGREGELMLAGWDKADWNVWGGAPGPDKDPPSVWIARSEAGASFELVRLDQGRLQPHVLGVPLVVWYDHSDQQYHCVLVHWHQWNTRAPKEIVRPWHYRASEYVGAPDAPLRLSARFEHNGFSCTSTGAVYKGKLILLDSQGRWAFVFAGPTVGASYRTIWLHPKRKLHCRLSDVTPDGRLLMGVYHYTTGDDMYMFERHFYRGLRGRKVFPANVTLFGANREHSGSAKSD